MIHRRAAVAAAVLMAASGAAWRASAQDAPAAQKPMPVALVDTLNKLSGGPHAGYRANHAKGVLVTGTFTPDKQAAQLSKAPHLRKPVPVTVRFSNATGVPTMPDADPNASPHGIAIRFQYDAKAATDIVSISANGFPVATPEDFLALLQAAAASGPGAAEPTPIKQFLDAHPAALQFVTTPRPAPQSFATLAFYGVNAFRFTNAKGVTRLGRYQIIPLAGEAALATDTGKPAEPNYLMDELPQRLAKGPVAFRLQVQLAQPGDVTNDATVVWPASNPVLVLGTISLTKTVADQAAAQKALLFNPVALPDGIAPSDDPVLAARFPAYAVSFGQRAR